MKGLTLEDLRQVIWEPYRLYYCDGDDSATVLVGTYLLDERVPSRAYLPCPVVSVGTDEDGKLTVVVGSE